MIRKKIKVKVLEGSPFLISEEEEIGRGCYGRVVRAYKKDEPAKQLVAKIIPLEEENKETIISELKILKQVPYHDNLVNCLKMQISSEHNFYLIMEYCNGGSFEKYIANNWNCSQELIWRFLKDFCEGYRVLYDCHLIHRDIKPENILLHNGRFKIADFGLSRKIQHHGVKQNISVKGTPLYIAPELKFESSGCSSLDVFSLGVVVFRLAYNGQFPFYDPKLNLFTIEQYFDHLAKTPLKFPKFPKRSADLEELITKMLEKDPAYRKSWPEIFAHPLIKKEKQKSAEEKLAPPELTNLRRSIVEIGRSSATIAVVPEPFNFRENINEEVERLAEFTRFVSTFEVESLQTFALRTKVMIELIRHLNGTIQSVEIPSGTGTRKEIKKELGLISDEGIIYCDHSLSTLIDIIKCYQSEIENKCSEQIISSLKKQKETFEQSIHVRKIKSSYEHLKYQNLLYDFLIQYTEREARIKQCLKIPVALMIDIYDGLLKLEAMSFINQQGRVEIKEIQLQDAELDKIDYQNLDSYYQYLDSINEARLSDVEGRLSKMGLIII